MKIQIDRSDLLRSLSHVQSVVERRTTIPILSNVKLAAKGNALSMTTTDMDLELVESVAADVQEEGVTTAPVLTLYDIVRKLPDGSKIEMVTDDAGTRMTVKSGRSVFHLGCLPEGDFPEMGGEALPTEFPIAASDLRDLIDRTKFAMSTEETRYYLNGIYLHAAERDGVQVLRAVATDGHRLARFEMPLPDGATGMEGIIIPRKTVGEIRKLIDEAADSVRVSLSGSRICFNFDHIVLTSKLIDGTFPDYERVIPANNNKVMEVDQKIFVSAIDRVSTISTEKTRAIKLALNGTTMTLSANSPDAGSATEDVEVAYEETDPLEIGFNSKYLLDITQQFKGDGCRLTLSDGVSPTIIEDSGDTSALYVLMPLRV